MKLLWQIKTLSCHIFYNYEKSPNFQDFLWRKYLDQFTIVRDKAEFKKMVLKILNSEIMIDSVISDKENAYLKNILDI